MQRTHKVAALVLAAVCALLAVAFVSEVGHEDEMQIVKEGASRTVPQEEASAQGMNSMQTHMVAVQKAGHAATIDDSRKETEAALKQSAQDMHKNNEEARKAEGRTVVLKAKKEFSDAAGQLTDSVTKTAKEADTKIAASVAQQEMADLRQGGGDETARSEAKIQEIKKMSDEMDHAVAEAEKQASVAKAKTKLEGAKYQKKIREEVETTKADFSKLEHQLDMEQGVRSKERSTRQELQGVTEKVKRLKDQYSSTHDQLQRIEERQHEFEQRRQRKVTEAKEELNGRLTKYRSTLKGLKTKLHEVKKATDINEEMASHIKTTELVVGKQRIKINQLKQDITRLTDELNHTHSNIQAFTAKAKERKHELHVAQSTVQYLSDAVKNLKTKATKQPATVEVTVPRGSSQQTAKHVEDEVVKAIKRQSTAAQKKMWKRVLSVSTSVAKHKAERMADKQAVSEAMHIQPLGVGDSLAAAGKVISQVGLAPTTATTPTKGEQPTLDRASATLSQLHAEAVSGEVHRAELMAHVAHTLFQKAVRTQSASDKSAAKVAMHKAITLRDALQVNPSQH